jgi:Short C-terminal domain
MLGNKWEQAQGTIVEAQTAPVSGRGVAAAMQVEHRYVVEVRRPTGEVIRGTVIDKSPGGYGVGTVIGVEVHSKSGEMRLDPSQQIVSVSAMMNAAGQMPGFGGPVGPYSHGGPRGNVMHVIGPGGMELPIQIDAAEVGRLAQAIRSGDPVARQAAMNQLRELRDQARAQMGGQTGAQFGGGPVPGAPGGDFGGAPGFSPAGQGGVEERLAMLKQLHDRGVLTESEYQAKRQQIIDGL